MLTYKKHGIRLTIPCFSTENILTYSIFINTITEV
ncbi:hypothetical protein protein [Bacillus cereus G9241]|nr:hypothetical protein protein [Bacillus cereus G9241]